MSVNKDDIKSKLLLSIQNNGQANGLDSDQSVEKFCDDVATIIKDAILSGKVKIEFTELTSKVTSSYPGSPVVCTQEINGSIE